MPERILVVAPSWVGDTVMSQPMLTLAEGAPSRRRRSTCWHPPWMLPLLGAHAGSRRRASRVRSGTASSRSGHGAGWRARSLRAATTQAIVLPNSWKSALVPWLAGIPRRTGFLGEFRYGLLNDARKLDPARLPQMVERFCALALDGGAALPDPLPTPRLASDPATRAALLERLGLRTDPPVVVLLPRRGVRSGETLAAGAFRGTRPIACRRAASQVWLVGSERDREATTTARRGSRTCVP